MASMDGGKSLITPTVFSIDTTHMWYTDLSFWLGGGSALLVTLKLFIESMRGFSGFLATAANPYWWNAWLIANIILGIAAIVLGVFSVIFVAVVAGTGSQCCGKMPIAWKSFRHLYTVMAMHFVHILFGIFLISIRVGAHLSCAVRAADGTCTAYAFSGEADPDPYVAYITVATEFKPLFYVMHAFEAVLCLWAIGAFYHAFMYFVYPEADARVAQKLHASA
jgi:hypothetical protein